MSAVPVPSLISRHFSPICGFIVPRCTAESPCSRIVCRIKLCPCSSTAFYSHSITSDTSDSTEDRSQLKRTGRKMWRLLTSSRDDRGARAARRSLEISFFRQDAISGLVVDAHKGGGVSVASNVFDTVVGSRMPSPCIAVRRAAAIDERARTAAGQGQSSRK